MHAVLSSTYPALLNIAPQTPAPGAKYPWAAVALPVPFEGYIKFTYDNGTPVYPWGDSIRTFTKGFGIASIPEELGNEFLLDNNGNTIFDPAKLSVKLLS